MVHVTTTGDRIRHASLNRLGGVGVFTREIQHALLDRRADLAVHSLKDLPTEPVDGICLAAVPKRASPWDALVLPRESPSDGGDLATCPRTQELAQAASAAVLSLLFLRPDLQFFEVRGNVETRLRKLDEGTWDGLILAEAGLDRLGLSERVSARLVAPELFPAVGQGRWDWNAVATT